MNCLNGRGGDCESTLQLHKYLAKYSGTLAYSTMYVPHKNVHVSDKPVVGQIRVNSTQSSDGDSQWSVEQMRVIQSHLMYLTISSILLFVVNYLHHIGIRKMDKFKLIYPTL